MGSSKNVLLPYHLVTSQTLAANFSSGTVAVPYMDNVAIQITFSASASTGTFAVSASLDGSGFVPLSLSANPIVNGSPDKIMITLNQVPFRYLTVNYAAGVAGTGSCDIWVMAKEMG